MIAERVNFFRWIPRILSITMAVFLSLVSRDLLYEFYRRPPTATVLTAITPAVVMVLVLILAWRRPKMAAIILLLMAAGWSILSSHHPELATAVGIPLLVNALLYWIGPGHTPVPD